MVSEPGRWAVIAINEVTPNDTDLWNVSFGTSHVPPE